MEVKKLVETALPLPEINDASAYDKMPGIGAHPKGIRKWKARPGQPLKRAGRVNQPPNCQPTSRFVNRITGGKYG
ncbi:hypothetical protein HRbin30_03280 [bacterium HR30]|nr:hypothetical protein HRbin30_03280 [bacterium HR30]